MESVDLGRTVAEPDAMAAVPEPVARRFLAVGLTLARDEGGAPRRLTVAMADPFDVIALDHLRSLFDGGAEIVPLLAGRSDVERFLERAYRHDLSVAGILREIETGEAGPGGLPANADEYSQPIVQLVDVLLSNAVKRGPPTSTSSRRLGSCGSATGSTACCAKSGASCATAGILSVWTVFLSIAIRTV